MKIYDKYRLRGDVHWNEYMTNENYRKWVNWLVELLPIQGDVLDLGCGDGLWCYEMIQRGLIPTGVDISDDGIKIAREKPELENVDLWAVELEFLAKHRIVNFKFDCCLATEIIEHLHDFTAVRSIFKKYIKDYMILTTVDRENSSHHSDYHTKEFSEKELRDMFRDYNVERIEGGDFGEFNTKETIVLKIKK